MEQSNHSTFQSFCLVAFPLFLVSVSAGCTSSADTSLGSCGTCHEVQLDEIHQAACTSCHQGDGQA